MQAIKIEQVYTSRQSNAWRILMKIRFLFPLIVVLISGCPLMATPYGIYSGDTFVAGYAQAKESVLRTIPVKYIDKARETLHVAYQHTSHGTHVAYGVFGLPEYKNGDNTLFAVCTPGSLDSNCLEFNDYAMCGYAAGEDDASDLSRNETAFVQATRNFLNDSENSRINVVMWSWCNIAGHDVVRNYLPGMKTLIDEYGPGGTSTRSDVQFIFMTGHANAGSNTGSGNPQKQAELITDFCEMNGYFCLDYYSIDTHAMDDTYYEDTGDNGQSASYPGGSNFYEDWQANGREGSDWYVNRETPGGLEAFGAHNSQHITANRKAYAMWWILARIVGWDGELE